MFGVVVGMSQYDTVVNVCGMARVWYSCQCVVGLCFSHSLCGVTLFQWQWKWTCIVLVEHVLRSCQCTVISCMSVWLSVCRRVVLFIFTMRQHLTVLTIPINHVFLSWYMSSAVARCFCYYACLMQLLVCVAQSDFSHSPCDVILFHWQWN